MLLGGRDGDVKAGYHKRFDGLIHYCVVHSFSCEKIANVGGTMEGALDDLSHLHGAIQCIL